MTNNEAQSILYQIEELIRTCPPKATIRHDLAENFAWFGRAVATINQWNLYKTVPFESYIADIQQSAATGVNRGYANIQITLHQARHDLRMLLDPQTNIAVEQGRVFEYFDEIRKIIELATEEVFFIDPYLDADFVSRYLAFVKDGVRIRLLTSQKLASLIPAITAFVQERGTEIEVRAQDGLHDRFIITDGNSCRQSGASFKDGAKNAPTTIVEVLDAFSAIKATYENLWATGTVKFPK